MDKTIDLLKDAIASQGIAIDHDAMFELIAVESCAGCCAESNGGNNGCKPAQ